MKWIFYFGIAGIIAYEIAKVYFIMPIPGSQRINSIDLAYFLHTWRWVFRIGFWLMIALGAATAFKKRTKWLPGIVLLLAIAITYATNYEMAADTMFYQPVTLKMEIRDKNTVAPDRLVIGIEENGEARAYPIQYLGYHHQVRDELSGKPVIVTYCTVCRTGRVFKPLIDQKNETFRLVGMDHFNAMFEDETTHSWWRQANGEAIAGPLKGKLLPELASTQTTLSQWLKLHPRSLIMQPDPEFQAKYDDMSKYESGKAKSSLTKTDFASWKDKSWVVGVQNAKGSKAFDWNRLTKERLVNDLVGGTPVVVLLASDNKSFFAFERITANDVFSLKKDTLFLGDNAFSLTGRNLTAGGKSLKAVNAYQEFWHSWRTFHPETEKY